MKILKEHTEGASFYSLEKKYDIVLGTVKRWNAAFRALGEEALERHNSNLCRYSAELKQKVVSDYLSGGGSLESIAVKYGIHAENTVLKWVKQYNSHEELTDSRFVSYISYQSMNCLEMPNSLQLLNSTIKKFLAVASYPTFSDN